MDKQEAYEDKLQARMKEWDGKIEELQAKAEQANPDVRVQCLRQVEDLVDKKMAIKHKLQDLRAANGDVLEDVMKGIDRGLSELEGAVNSILFK